MKEGKIRPAPRKFKPGGSSGLVKKEGINAAFETGEI
jgi:hypothetical protein